jgi:hypothetical protein
MRAEKPINFNHNEGAIINTIKTDRLALACSRDKKP